MNVASWIVAPSTSIGLLVLIAFLHVVEDLVQNTIRIVKLLAMSLLILLRIKASTSGAKYLYKGINLLLETAHSSSRPPDPSGTQPGTQPDGSLDFNLFLAVAKRARDIASQALSRTSEVSESHSAMPGEQPHREPEGSVGVESVPKEAKMD